MAYITIRNKLCFFSLIDFVLKWQRDTWSMAHWSISFFLAKLFLSNISREMTLNIKAFARRHLLMTMMDGVECLATNELRRKVIFGKTLKTILILLLKQLFTHINETDNNIMTILRELFA